MPTLGQHPSSQCFLGRPLVGGQAVCKYGLSGRLRRVDAGALPHAADTARLSALLHAAGGGVAPEHAEPAYLRNNVALTLAEQAARRG